MSWAATAAAVAVAGAAPFVAERLRPKMDGARRETAPGRFAELSDGLTHYRWYGPGQGPVALCVHGLTTPSFVWDGIARGLAGHGFRVLTYDLYGRGFSDRPKGAQTRTFFLRQLRELIDHEGIDGPLTVLGYSMGGGIATIFAAEEPDRLRRLILLAPAGLVHNAGTFAEATRRLPVIGDWLMLAFGGAYLRRIARTQPAHPSIRADIGEAQAAETRLQGYLPAVLSSQRNLLAQTLEEEHRTIAVDGVPVLAIWGEQDDVIPLRAMSRLAELNDDARQVMIKGAGHGLAYTHTHEVLAAMEDALAEDIPFDV